MARLEVAAFTFHEVCDDPSTSGLQRPAAMPYKHSTAAFRATLDAIAGAGIAPRILDDAPTGRHIALTFDDGGASNTWTARELERRGWKGYFFLVSSFIGRPGFMDAPAIRDLHQAGHEVGNHSATHPDIFRDLPPDQIREEFRICRDRIEQITGVPCVTGSVPGGDSSRAVFRAAAATGLHHLFTSEPTYIPTTLDGLLIFGRANVKAATPPPLCASLARFEGWQREHAIYRAKQSARKLLAPLYRAYVARATRPFAHKS